MNIVFFVHPPFLESLSMPKFANLLADGMRERGHTVKMWSPQPKLYDWPVPKSFRKWMGYIDQYVIFPKDVKKELKSQPKDTLYIFLDQALGPWVSLVADKPHVIHCHDFLAQRSGLGEVPQNKNSWTGTKYQEYIRHGYRKGRNFISVSENTRKELHFFLGRQGERSEMVYNGLNQFFAPADPEIARKKLQDKIKIDLSKGFLLNVGGNQWYKNRWGVLEIYNAWRSQPNHTLPLLMIGRNPGPELIELHNKSPFKKNIHFIAGLTDEDILTAYQGATVFLFPSLAEGFGWPIAEAMASGCPVITTNEAPMTEVAGDAALLMSRRPFGEDIGSAWAKEGASVINQVIEMSPEERATLVCKGVQNAKRFDTKDSLNEIERIYKSVLQSQNN